MPFAGLNLVIPDKADQERDAVADAWAAGSGTVTRLDKFWEPPASLEPASVRLYGYDAFCLVLEQKLGLALVSPPDELLLTLDPQWTARRVWGAALSSMQSAAYPLFSKPVVPKLFRAGVFESWQSLQTETRGLPPETRVLVSEVVEFDAEVRAFVLRNRVVTMSLYEGAGDLEAATLMLAGICENAPLPSTCVLDLGHIAGRGWGLVEANATWGAGLNGCDPAEVARCIAAATRLAPPVAERADGQDANS